MTNVGDDALDAAIRRIQRFNGQGQANMFHFLLGVVGRKVETCPLTSADFVDALERAIQFGEENLAAYRYADEPFE